MSLILKALRKAQEEKKRGHDPGGEEIISSQLDEGEGGKDRNRAIRINIILVAFALCLVAVMVGWLSMYRSTITDSKESSKMCSAITTAPKKVDSSASDDLPTPIPTGRAVSNAIQSAQAKEIAPMPAFTPRPTVKTHLKIPISTPMNKSSEKQTLHPEVATTDEEPKIIIKATTAKVPDEKQTSQNLLERADTLLGEGRLDEAILAYEKALEIDANSLTTLLSLSELYVKIGKPDKAKDYLGRAAALGRDNPQILNNLGIMASRIGDDRLALTYYMHALSLSPNFCEAHLNAALAHHRLGEVEKAIDFYARFIELAPGRYDEQIWRVKQILESLKASTASE